MRSWTKNEMAKIWRTKLVHSEPIFLHKAKRTRNQMFKNLSILPAPLMSPFVLRLNHTILIWNGTYLVCPSGVLFHQSRHDNLEFYFLLKKNPTTCMYYKSNVTYLSINFHFTKCTFSCLIELMRVKFMLVE